MKSLQTRAIRVALFLLALSCGCREATEDDPPTPRPTDAGHARFHDAAILNDAGLTPSMPDAGDISDAQTKAPITAACIENIFHEQLAAMIGQTCASCHFSGGAGHYANLTFENPLNDIDSKLDASNLTALLAFLSTEKNRAIFLQKPLGEMGHGGGIQIKRDSAEAEAIAYFVSLLREQGECTPLALPPLAQADFQLANPKLTAQLASLLLTNNLPSQNELDALTSDINSIDPILDRIMDEETFFERISQIYEDMLHTNMYRSRHQGAWAQRTWGMAVDSSGATRGRHRWMDDYFAPQSDEWKTLLNNSTFGFSRSPVKLIEYVLREHRDFGEILTADYTLVNPYSVRNYDAMSLISDSNFVAAVDGASDEEYFLPVVLTEVPTAGLLTDINFLIIYPSGKVNLNRNRAREVLDHFLNLDILNRTNRAVEDFGSTMVNPTYNNVNCVQCHATLDPIGGSFQNWPRIGYQGVYDPASPNAQARFSTTDPENLLRPAGFTMERSRPESEKDRGVQWLAEQIIDSPRFAYATAVTMLEGLTGREVMTPPNLDDADHAKKYRIFKYEQSQLEAAATAFMTTNRNLRTLLKVLIKSPLIRAQRVLLDNPYAEARVGLNKLLHPEDLERRLQALLGYSWFNYVQRTNEDELNRHWNNHIDRKGRSLLMEYRETCGTGYGCYGRWYSLLGGLDIHREGGNATRLNQPNLITAAIFDSMSGQMARRLVPRDFAITSTTPNGTFRRRLFPFVDLDTVPKDENMQALPINVDRIKRNLQHLHQTILLEDLNLTDPEIEHSYQLFHTIWLGGRPGGRQLNLDDKVEQSENDYLANHEAQLGLPTLNRRVVLRDTHNTILAWKAVLDYLIGDFTVAHQVSHQTLGSNP